MKVIVIVLSLLLTLALTGSKTLAIEFPKLPETAIPLEVLDPGCKDVQATAIVYDLDYDIFTAEAIYIYVGDSLISVVVIDEIGDVKDIYFWDADEGAKVYSPDDKDRPNGCDVARKYKGFKKMAF